MILYFSEPKSNNKKSEGKRLLFSIGAQLKIFDLSQIKSGSVLEADLCVVGSGPAGLSIANEFAGTEIRVVILESGGLEDEPETQGLYAIESTGDPRVINQDTLRTRVLGGSSHIWTGRCAPFDESDFEQRSWIPYSGWPFQRGELQPYFDRAAAYLGLASGPYDETLWQRFGVTAPQPALSTPGLGSTYWQFSRSRFDRGPTHFGKEWTECESRNLEILLHANVTHINTNANGTRFESLDVSALNGKRACVRASYAVLCCGGIENARLLLASNHFIPEGLGNRNDLVGRFLMDHVNATIGCFDTQALKTRSRFGHYWLDDSSGRHVYLHGFGLSKTAQQTDRLLNCHAYIEDFGIADDDPWIALKRLKDSARSGHLAASDMRLVFGQMGEIWTGLQRRFFQHRAQLSKTSGAELHLMLEQIPNPESRVTLSKYTKDALDMPVSSIHWKISDTERITALRMFELVTEELKRLGLPKPRNMPELKNRTDWVSRSTEKAHPTGTTRMASDPRFGVVDINCEVHDVRGLFVAGSSIFPTTGAANPTFMIVATAIRLADHLKQAFLTGASFDIRTNQHSLRDSYESRSRSTTSSSALRVGLVGAGRRLLNIYIPILRELSDQYDLVGFTALSRQGFRRMESQTGIQPFLNAEELVKQARPELLIVAVPDRLNESTVQSLLDLKVPILAETPLAWSVFATRRIMQKAMANNVILGVAEQFPFLPLEQFRHKLLSSGALGTIYSVRNDFQSYSYHAIAQLRRYINGKPSAARCNEMIFQPSAADGSRIFWQLGSVEFNDGSLLLHHFATPDKVVPGSIDIFGTLGNIHDNRITLIDPLSRRNSQFSILRSKSPTGRLRSIYSNIPDAGSLTWDNPFAAHPFSDEQIAVALLLEGMRLSIRQGKRPLYTASDFQTDMEIVRAFQYSVRRANASIPLPLSENRQKVLLLTDPKYFKYRFSKRPTQ